jgi:hypothetical protein
MSARSMVRAGEVEPLRVPTGMCDPQVFLMTLDFGGLRLAVDGFPWGVHCWPGLVANIRHPGVRSGVGQHRAQEVST